MPYSSPILQVKKPHSDKYQFVQDLRALYDVIQGIHPMVSNPYIVLATMPKDRKWFLVPELKDAFLCILIDEQAQLLFAFE